MTSFLRYAMDWLGLGAAFTFAALTYATFHFLDRNASLAAKRAISALLAGTSYRNLDLSAGVISAFDHLYGRPLLHWRSFLRVAIYTIIADLTLSTWYYGVHIINVFINFQVIANVSGIGMIILSDYISLLVIRQCLSIGQYHLLLATLGGFILVICMIIFIQAILISVYSMIRDEEPFIIPYLGVIHIITAMIKFQLSFADLVFIFGPVFVVAFWLPIFWVSVLVTRILNVLFLTVQWAQWFIKQGQHHPLRAIGIVAAGLVLLASGIAEIFR